MANTNRTGRVSAVNYAAGTYEVTYFDRGRSVTRVVNAVSNGEYRMPQVGDMVAVNHNSTSQADATAAGTIWNRRNAPTEGFEGLYRKEYGRKNGRAYLRYDDNSGVLREYTPGGTGRNTNGELYDEAKGPMSFVAALAMTLKSLATVGIQGGRGVAINSGGNVTIEAAGAVSEECEGGRSVAVGGDNTLTVGGKDEETFSGAAKRSYKAAVTEVFLSSVKRTVTGLFTRTLNGKANLTYNDDVMETYNADTERKHTGDITEKVEGTVTQEVTGDVTQTVEGNVTQEITGDVTQTVTGNVSLTVGGTTVEIAASGDVTVTATKASVTAAEVTVEADTGDIKVDGVSLVHHKHKGGGADEPEKG